MATRTDARGPTSVEQLDLDRRCCRLDGRVALVTGASSGLGARFAAVLHAAGTSLVITARRDHRPS